MIDLRVMNNFSHNEQAAILENLASGVREIDRAFDAVTETKLLRQAHCRISHGNDSASTANLFNDIAPVVRLDLLLHRRHHVRRAQVHFLAGSCAAGNQVCAHLVTVILGGAKNLGLLGPREQQNNGQRCFAPLNMTQLGVGGNAQAAYSSNGPLGASNAASEIMREAGGSGV
jgi:hypothetical protein